jgi:putative NIF3 family GTP cyclohydrolase 1 type 2
MTDLTRRQILSAMGAVALAPRALFAQASTRLTAQDVFDRIKKATGEASWRPDADDRIIWGDLSVPVTGICTSFYASMDLLAEAKRAGANFVVPHECTLYERLDQVEAGAIRDDDPVLKAKKAFITDNQMVVLRMHGHGHSLPGGAFALGQTDALGWTAYRDAQTRIVTLPAPMTARDVGRHIKRSLNLKTLRVFGDLNQRISTLTLSMGQPGINSKIGSVNAPVDGVILGEVRENEVVGFMQDVAQQGRPVVVFMVGHLGTEDAPTKAVATFLQGVFPDLKVQYIPSIDPFTDPV